MPRRVNLFELLHQHLRGRYHWAIILSVTLSVLAAVSGHLFVHNMYQSNGCLQIKPVLSKILYSVEQNNVMPMFDSYVDTQVTLMQSPRAIQMAMDSAAWKNATQKLASYDVAQFTDSLQVTHPKGTELIQIAFTDRDPQIAAIAVKAVIDAYLTISAENDSNSDAKTIETLEARKTLLTTQLVAPQNAIQTIANEYGTDDLNEIYEPKLEEFNRLEASLHDAEIVLANAPPDTGAATQPAATQDVPLTPELVGRSGDEVMRRLLDNREQQQQSLSELRRNYGESSRAVTQAADALDATNTSIADLLQKYKDAGIHLSSGALSGSGTSSVAMTQKEAQFHVAELKALSDQAKTELLDIGRKDLEIHTHQREMSDIQKELDDVRQRIDALNVESAVGGRTTVISTGDIPFRPIKDRNRTATMGGGFAGLLFGVLFVAFIGMRDRRLKNVADAELYFDRSNRILGILPALPENLADPEQASTAAYCVHHVRTLLQLGSGNEKCPVVAVTSAAPGEGKTSLVLSLGHSYAATGIKTLLIDFDVIGTGLTKRSGAIVRRKLGEILARKGLINAEGLDDALIRSVNSGKRLGEILVESRTISESDLESALKAQHTSQLGLLDVIDGEPLTRCVSNGQAKGLYVLPVGSVETNHVGQMSLRQVQRIVQQARAEFDMVLIDTGPILGSLEACTVAAVADEVIVVVSRGQIRPLIDKAFARLSEVGAHIAGIVFNRASEQDVLFSSYSSQRSSNHVAAMAALNGEEITGQNAPYLGPVAHAVAHENTPADVARKGA